MKKKINRDRVSSKTQLNSSEILHPLFRDLALIYSGKLNLPKDERENI